MCFTRLSSLFLIISCNIKSVWFWSVVFCFNLVLHCAAKPMLSCCTTVETLLHPYDNLAFKVNIWVDIEKGFWPILTMWRGGVTVNGLAYYLSHRLYAIHWLENSLTACAESPTTSTVAFEIIQSKLTLVSTGAPACIPLLLTCMVRSQWFFFTNYELIICDLRWAMSFGWGAPNFEYCLKEQIGYGTTVQ